MKQIDIKDCERSWYGVELALKEGETAMFLPP